METYKFNKQRLNKYANYLLQNDLKCDKFFDTCSEEEIPQDIRDNKELKPLLLIPIMEIPLIFEGE